MITEVEKVRGLNKTSELVLASHFLCLAEDTDKMGERLLARHFLAIALDLFGSGPNTD